MAGRKDAAKSDQSTAVPAAMQDTFATQTADAGTGQTAQSGREHMTRQRTKMFGIDTVAQYLEFCTEAVTEFEREQDNVLRAFGAILALNHIPDWLRYKLTDKQRATLHIASSRVGDSVTAHFESHNEDLKRVRDIANGFKHLRPTHSTEVVAGYGRGPYGVGPYGAPYLLIDLGADLSPNKRWDVGLSLCKRVIQWWRNQLLPLTETTEEPPISENRAIPSISGSSARNDSSTKANELGMRPGPRL